MSQFGASYDEKLDGARLRRQAEVIRDVMLSAGECADVLGGRGGWQTLEEIARLTGYPPASVSADLRHLRKKRFGGYRVEKRRRTREGSGQGALRADLSRGLWEYRVSRPESQSAEQLELRGAA